MRWLAPAAVAAAALIAAACGSSGNSGSSGSSGNSGSSQPSGSASGSALKTAKIRGVAVLTNAHGRTLYSFVPDTSTKSNCNGACAQVWPPVKGPAKASSGVATAKLGTIKRNSGATQATYKGHPLYTYTADTAAGQDKGNGINSEGGIWHVVPASAAAAPASTSSGGNFGY
jgi:predicted lipoprotein with Yx(FWY)xxD motif